MGKTYKDTKKSEEKSTEPYDPMPALLESKLRSRGDYNARAERTRKRKELLDALKS